MQLDHRGALMPKPTGSPFVSADDWSEFRRVEQDVVFQMQRAEVGHLMRKLDALLEVEGLRLLLEQERSKNRMLEAQIRRRRDLRSSGKPVDEASE